MYPLQHVEEDSLVSGNPPEDQALWPLAATGKDRSIRQAGHTVLVMISE